MKTAPPVALTFYFGVPLITLSRVNKAHSFSLPRNNDLALINARISIARTGWCLTSHLEERIEPEAVKTVQGPFSTQIFASSRCWGHHPLLIKSAFNTSELITNSDDSFWPTWDEILDIASDEDAGARLIQHRPKDLESFTLDLGPFNIVDLQDLSKPQNADDRKWALVVNDVDRFYPPLSDWMEETFSFVPRWRLDDGQVSLAQTGGGIGPHVDNYDVFLIQMSGIRIWELGNEPVSVEKEMESLVQGIDVRVLRHWDEERARGGVKGLEVSPGDLLYLPPRVAHCGAALSDSCMTLSVGCRAPSASELVSRVAAQISETLTGGAVRRYEDPNLLDPLLASTTSDNLHTPPVTTGEIVTTAKVQMKELVRNAVNEIISDDLQWDELIGRLVTESSRPRENYPVPLFLTDGKPYDKEWNNSLGVWGDPNHAVQTVLYGNGALYHAEGISFSFSAVNSYQKHHRLFANGEMFEIVTDTDNEVVPHSLRLICSQKRLVRENLMSSLKKGKAECPVLPPEIVKLLVGLTSKGLLYGSDK